MSLTHFICPPDGERISIRDCLKWCRLPKRCATRAYLQLAGHEREYKGVTPSMAGNGARLELLKITKDCAVNPYSRAFAALGTSVHGRLDLSAYTDNVLSEEPLEMGTPDCLEKDPLVEAYHLTDYKTWGSYKVGMALGMAKTDVPVFDDAGEPVLLKSGKNKGKPKTNAVWALSGKSDMQETVLQLNRYRIGFEKLGFPINIMRVQAIVRDGNTYIAKSRGITENIYLIHVPFMQDAEVLAFYDNLSDEITEALKVNHAPKCTKEQTWDGRRCESYCDVSQACEEMGE